MASSRKWLLLSSSAIIYGLSFIFSTSFWWAASVFLVPLFYAAATQRLSFKEGFFYGAFLWTFAGSAVIISLYSMGQGPLVLRCIPPLIIVLFEALCAGLWFWGTSFIANHFSSNKGMTLCLWSITTTLYFYWVILGSLGAFNAWEGYFLMNPLLPLAEHPELLSLVPMLGKELLLFVLVGTNLLFTLPFLSRKKSMWAVSFLGLVPWIISSMVAPERQAPPAWLNQIATISTIYSPGSMLTPMAEDIQKRCQTILGQYPSVKVIILPESSLDGVNLQTAHELGQLWNTQHLGKALSLVVGAFFWEGDNYRNTIYWLFDGVIKDQFYKRHAMALTETTVSTWYDYPFIRKLYNLSDAKTVRPSLNARVVWPLLSEISFVPYICSELFFNDKPDDPYPQAAILALCNDNWSKLQYLRRLMFLTARFKAVEWNRDIIYASYYYTGYIDKQGSLSPIPN